MTYPEPAKLTPSRITWASLTNSFQGLRQLALRRRFVRSLGYCHPGRKGRQPATMQLTLQVGRARSRHERNADLLRSDPPANA